MGMLPDDEQPSSTPLRDDDGYDGLDRLDRAELDE